MSDEIKNKAEDGDHVNENETKDKEQKHRSVSFNKDVHVKRFGKPRESRGASSEPPVIRKEPFTHLSEQELINEANKVLAQAQSVTCTTDHPPEKFFSLPHRRKFKEERIRRNSDDGGSPDSKRKSPLGRSTSDVSSKKRKERTSLSTIFRRAQRNKSPDATPVIVATKPVAVVKRSKSDVSDLKSKNVNINVNTQPKPIRKRSGSESEEFLKSLRNKKTQLSPIIESSPREDYFQKISPLDIHEQENKRKPNSKPEIKKTVDNKKVNPVEKPPRYKTTEKLDPKPPSRTRRGKSIEKERDKKEKSPIVEPLLEKKVLVDKHDCAIRDNKPLEVKSRIKESIRKIEENIYGDKDMIHSSQQPPDKPPLTRGHTVDPIVRILKEDQTSPPPKSHLISPTNGNNVNQPFSYIKPSVSPDPNLFARNTSPERVPSPVNKMDKGAVYAQVIRGRGENGLKHNIHKETSPFREKYANFSDEDEGLGYEERYKYAKNDYELKKNTGFDSVDGYRITDSPIKPKYREYKLTTNFKDIEPTYANEYPSKEDITRDYIDTFRGRADGMDTIRKLESEMLKDDLAFNELSHRRQMLESRLNARRVERERNVGEPISRYLAETDPIYEAQKRMKATEKYVNEITSKYYRHTLERDGFAESTITEDYSKYDSDNNRIKYNTEMRTVNKLPNGDFIDGLEKPRYSEDRKVFPPEPEYEPPSLEFNAGKSKLTPDEYKEKKYRVKKHFTSSQDALQTGQKYKKDSWFGKRKGHYASNPEIAHEREDDYANLPYHARHPESYHNSLRRKSKDRYYKDDFAIKRHDSGDSRDYYRENRTRKFEIDNRLVDSGIENDFRKDSNIDIHKRYRHDSYDDVRDTSLFLDSERRHTEDNYPNEQIYANGDYLARYEDFNGGRKEYEYKKFDEDSHLDPKMERYDISPSHRDDKISAKPPKAKKLSGLDRVKQLFSRDSSKKSKKEKDIVQPRSRTRVLKSPEHLANDDPEYRRYTDPEPSDIEARKREYGTKAEDRRYKSSREDVRHRTPDPREAERKYREYDGRYERTLKEESRHHERHEKRRYHSSDRESETLRPSDMESELRKTRSRTAGPMDSPGLAERYRERRRLATPSPSPSPPRRELSRPATSSWFKSLDRIGKKKDKNQKLEKESILTTEDESTRKTYKPTKPLNSPAKNLRFFGDTDQDSDATTVKNTVTKTRSHPIHKSHGTLRKTTSNSSTGVDEVDHQELSSKSYSLSNLNRREEKSESPRTKQYYKRNLHNISEIQSNSETESHLGRKVSMKPPISPYERQSRSHSSSKTLKGKNDVKKRTEDRSGSELRGSKQEINRDIKSSSRRRTPAPHSGESSTEGDSSHQSQRSVVYLHATTVGDIPDPGAMSRNRSRDDISSINSSNFQVKHTTKTFSLFAPWTPKHYGEQHDLHYAQKPRKSKSKDKTPIKSLNDERPGTLQKKKSYSQTTLSRRPQNNRLTSSSTTLHRKPEKRLENSSRKRETSQSSELIERNDDRIARSISMPKDNSKKAGWFNLSNKNKKQEINTRVR